MAIEINRLLQSLHTGTVSKELADEIAQGMGYTIRQDSKGVYAIREGSN